MRKIVLILAVMFAATALQAQISFGPKIGYNTSKLSTDKEEISSNLKNSFQFGIFLRLGNKYYIQPELNYLTQGGVYKNPGEDGSLAPFEQEINLKTIQIPAMIGVELIDLKVGNIRAMAGPVASIITNKEIETTNTSGYISPIEDADIEDMIWSGQVGLGADVLMFTLDVRYNFGLNKVIGEVDYQHEGETKSIVFDSRTSGWNVSLGWKIF